MRVRGDNSDGFRNEINIEKCLDFKMFEELNPNLQHFISDVFKGYSVKGKRIHAIRCRINVKPDFYLHIDDIPKEVYVSVKKGSGNSVHQESFDSFLEFMNHLHASEQIIDDLKMFHYGDGTTDNTGAIRYTAREFTKTNPEIITRLNEFFAQKSVMEDIIERVVFKGNYPDAPVAQYLYHGSAFSGVWASKEEIYDYISSNIFFENSNCVHIGPLTYQVWNRNLNFNLSAEIKRQQMQVKWSNLEDMLTQITSTRKAIKQRGTEEGTLDEISSVVFFNRDPENIIFKSYLYSIKKTAEKVLLVRVTTKQFSKLSNQKVMTRADAYAIEITNDDLYDVLEENEFYLDEDILANYKSYYKFVASSGISIKIHDSTGYQLIKLTPNSFNQLFDSYELGAGASLFCQNQEELRKNIALIDGWNSDIEKMQEYFSIFNISEKTISSSMELCKQIKMYSVSVITEKIDSTPKLQQIIFNGMYIYEEPYVAYFFMQNNKIEVLKYIPYSVTTGSGRSHGNYTIVLKPKQR